MKKKLRKAKYYLFIAFMMCLLTAIMLPVAILSVPWAAFLAVTDKFHWWLGQVYIKLDHLYDKVVYPYSEFYRAFLKKITLGILDAEGLANWTIKSAKKIKNDFLAD